MIIMLSTSDLNQRAVVALAMKQAQMVLENIAAPASEQIDASDHVLTLVNLDANGREQTYLNATILATRLINAGLLTHIKDIQLLISDIIPEVPMLGYATELSKAIIAKKPESNINVRVLADIRNCTLIEPPLLSHKDWTIYALPSEKVKALKPPTRDYAIGGFEFYRSVMTKVYCGPIHDQLNDPRYLITAETVRNTYGNNAEDPDLFASISP
ncbi:MAG TPA: hypothetical protein VHD33_04135 [Legionellaceae bacterium]|nr:hypothetical protein [Legionellaceae bacterium]